MQTYDILMLIVMGAAILFGLWKGLAWQVASTGSIILSYIAAYHFREPVSKMIDAAPPWNMFLAMFLLFMGTWIGVWIAFRFVKSFIERVKLQEFDRHAGGLLGAVKGAVLCTLITFFCMTLLGESQRTAICNSHSGYWIAQGLNHLDAVMPEELHAQLSPYLERLEKELDHNHPDHPPHADGAHADGAHAHNNADDLEEQLDEHLIDAKRAARALLDVAEELRSR